MFVFGHLATTCVAARWAGEKVEVRWVILFSLLADLVDKPIGLLLLRDSFNSGRIYGHSLLINLVLTFVLVLLHKPLIYSLALWLHQFCDLKWTRPWVALWPFAGPLTYRDFPLNEWVIASLNPYHVVAEVVGSAVVVCFLFRKGLLDRRRLLCWMRTGTLPRKGNSRYREIKESLTKEVGKDTGNFVY